LIVAKLKRHLTATVPMFAPVSECLLGIKRAAEKTADEIDCSFSVSGVCAEDAVASKLMFGSYLLGKYSVRFISIHREELSFKVSLFADSRSLQLE
jgi:hypothetical protein